MMPLPRRFMNLCNDRMRLTRRFTMRGLYPMHRMRLMITQRSRWRGRIFIRIPNPILRWGRWSSMESQNMRLRTNRWK